MNKRRQGPDVVEVREEAGGPELHLRLPGGDIAAMSLWYAELLAASITRALHARRKA